MTNTLIKRTEGNLIIHCFTEPDEDPDLSFLEQDYSDVKSREEREKYKAQDRERLAAYHRGEWYMVGVCCEISVKTKTNWAVPTVIASSSVWGVESDSGEYLMELAEDQIAEAKHDLENLKAALCGGRK